MCPQTTTVEQNLDLIKSYKGGKTAIIVLLVTNTLGNISDNVDKKLSQKDIE